MRQEPRLDAAHGADQDRLEAGRHGAQRLGDRERGHEVAAGTTARDQDAGAGGCDLGTSRSRSVNGER